jgi:hypothetical protein
MRKKRKQGWKFSSLIIPGIITGISLLVLIGCSSTKSATMYDASVPMEEQCIIDLEMGVWVTAIDGEPLTKWRAGTEIYIPSGTHELTVNVNTVRTISYTRWDINGYGIRFNRDFEAGHIYQIVVKAIKEAAEPQTYEGLTFYHEGDITAWLELEDITGSFTWNPVPVSSLASDSGVLTNWDRPVGLYLQSAGFAGLYTGYRNVKDLGDYVLKRPEPEVEEKQFDPLHSGSLGLDLQLGFEAGYAKFGAATLAEFSGGLGFDGYSGFAIEWDIGLMEFFYYDKIMGLGLGAGIWGNSFLPSLPHIRGQVSVFPTISGFTHDFSLYYDYFPQGKDWGIGAKWSTYLWGNPVLGNAKTLR